MILYFVTLGNYGDYLNPFVAVYKDKSKAEKYCNKLRSNKDNLLSQYYKVEKIKIRTQRGLIN